MATRSRPGSAPLTFDLPLSLIERIEACRRSRSLKTASDVIRLALDQYDFDGCKPVHNPHRQISVRIAARQRAALKRYARAKRVSVGELLRFALEDLTGKSAKKGKR